MTCRAPLGCVPHDALLDLERVGQPVRADGISGHVGDRLRRRRRRSDVRLIRDQLPADGTQKLVGRRVVGAAGVEVVDVAAADDLEGAAGHRGCWSLPGEGCPSHRSLPPHSWSSRWSHRRPSSKGNCCTLPQPPTTWPGSTRCLPNGPHDAYRPPSPSGSAERPLSVRSSSRKDPACMNFLLHSTRARRAFASIPPGLSQEPPRASVEMCWPRHTYRASPFGGTRPVQKGCTKRTSHDEFSETAPSRGAFVAEHET